MILNVENYENQSEIEPRRSRRLIFNHQNEKKATRTPQEVPRGPQETPRDEKYEKRRPTRGAQAIKPDLAGERKAHAN